MRTEPLDVSVFDFENAICPACGKDFDRGLTEFKGRKVGPIYCPACIRKHDRQIERLSKFVQR